MEKQMKRFENIQQCAEPSVESERKGNREGVKKKENWIMVCDDV